MPDDALMSTMLLPFWVSIKLAAVTTLCLLIIATPLSYWLAKPSRYPWLARTKILIMGVVAMPLVLPPTVIGFYLLLLMSPNSAVGGWFLQAGLGNLIFSFEGLVLGSIIYSLPFFVQPVYAQFLRIPPSLMEAAALLEPNRFKRFTRVALPQVYVGIVLGSLISFAHTIGEFGLVLMIGGSIAGETKVLSIAIYEQVEALNYDTAHMMSAILVVVGMAMVAMIAGINRLLQRQ